MSRSVERRLAAQRGTSEPRLILVCPSGHITDFGTHIEAWEVMMDGRLDCQTCGSEYTDIRIKEHGDE